MITIALITAPDVNNTLVERIVEEAEAIWGGAGVTLSWDRASRPAMPHAHQIVVMLDDEQLDFSEGQGALGWIPFTPDGPEPLIHLSRARAESLCSRSPNIEDKTIAGHERLLGRALGRALSHELGHYLFQSKTHTARGLMRAVWPSDELFSMDRRGFELTADQRVATEQQLQVLGRWPYTDRVSPRG